MSEYYKVVVLGNGGVGKSALTIQLVQNRFVAAYDPTIEDSYKKALLVDDKEVMLEILDTAGQDDFAAIRSTYMRSGQGFVVVFAVNDPSSFDGVEKFQREIKVTSGKDDIPIIVCGNKCDLEEREIKMEEAQKLCNDFKPPLKYFETSAKKNYNVTEAFMEVVKLMRQQNPAMQNGETKKNPSNEEENEGGGGCCAIF